MKKILIGLLICIVIEAVLICELIFRVNSIEDKLTLQNDQIVYIEGEIDESTGH